MLTSSSQSDDGCNLWTSILNANNAKTAMPTKTLLVLGNTACGKSTLIHRLGQVGELGPPLSVYTKRSSKSPENNPSSVTQGALGGDSLKLSTDLGVSYTYVDVKEIPEPNVNRLSSTAAVDPDELIGRLGIFQVASPSHTDLISISKQKLLKEGAMAVIILDWNRPQSWIDDLRQWLLALEQFVSDSVISDDSTPEESGGPPNHSCLDELRANLVRHFQQYQDPSTVTSEPTPSSDRPASTSSISSVLVKRSGTPIDFNAPLGPGVLTHNLGIPIAIVCSKSDHMHMLEKDLGMDDDRFDAIQQVIRIIALSYGASLFYTSLAKQKTMNCLRQYIQYRLFPSSAHSHLTVPIFAHPANVIDRDCVFVPSGWDSLGKIKVQRDFEHHSSSNIDPKILDSFPHQPSMELDQLWTSLVPMTAATLPVGGGNKKPNVEVTATEDQMFLERQLAAIRAAVTPAGSFNFVPSNEHVRLIPHGTTNIAATPLLDSSQRKASFSQPIPSQSGTPNSSTIPLDVSSGLSNSSTADQNTVLANFFQSLISNKPKSTTTVPPSTAGGERADSDKKVGE